MLGNWLTQMSVCVMIYLPIIAGGETKRVGGWSQVPALFGSALQVIGNEAWLSMKPQPLLKLFLMRCVEVFLSFFLSFVLSFFLPPPQMAVHVSWCSEQYGGASEIDGMTHGAAMFCQFWLPRLVQTYVCLFFRAPCLNSPSTVSDIHFSALTQNLIHTQDHKF